MSWRWPVPFAERRRGLRLLLVGFGARGRQWAEAAARHRQVQLVGVVDPAADARQTAASRRLPAWAALDEALAAARPDAALVASPPAAHAADARRCLDAGLAVLVEKPLAPSLAEARELAAASRASRPVLVGQSFRFLPRSRAVDRALAAGWIGVPHAGLVIATRPARPAPGAAGIEHAPLWDFAIHHFDLARLRFGGVPARVEATCRPAGAAAGDGAARTYAIEFAWADGAAFAYRHREGPPFFHHHEWIEGEHGGLCVEDRRVTLVTTRHRPRPVRAGRGPSPEGALLDALAAAARGGGASRLDAADNLGTIAMVEAAVAALRGRRPVTLAEVAAAAGVDLAPRAGP